MSTQQLIASQDSMRPYLGHRARTQTSQTSGRCPSRIWLSYRMVIGIISGFTTLLPVCIYIHAV